jgi:RNA polymerase sigma-70 factor, ECF subfamily
VGELFAGSALALNVGHMPLTVDFENLVDRYYGALYRFALSLTRKESDACDLTQQTFYIWATKGHQLQDPTKVKTWLFTTLHREFLLMRRRKDRFIHYELAEVDDELPRVAPDMPSRFDAQTVLHALGKLDPIFQAPIALFYLEDFPYKEIASVLEIPMGTVKSRISRGVAQLQNILTKEPTPHALGRSS